MKILYISAGFFDNNAISTRARFNVSEFCKNGLNTDVLTLRAKAATNSLLNYNNGFIIHAINLSVGRSGASFFSRLCSEILIGVVFSYKLYRLRKSYKFYYLTTPPFFSALICKTTLNFLGLRHVVEVRDRYPQVLFDLNVLSRDSFVSSILLAFEKYLYKNAEIVFCVTDSQKIKIKNESGFDAIVVRNGYNSSLFTDKITVIKNKDNESSCLKVVTHGLFGKLFNEKTFLSLVEYCHFHNLNVKFLLIGHGPKLESILNLKLSNVEFCGNLDGREIPKILSDVDVGLSVHLDVASDTFPVKVYEFIGSGLPSIIFPMSEAGVEIESKMMGWTFDSKNIDKCYELFENISKNKNLLIAYKKNVLINQKEYSRQVQALIIINKIKDLLIYT